MALVYGSERIATIIRKTIQRASIANCYMILEDKHIDELFRNAANQSSSPEYHSSYWKEMEGLLNDSKNRRKQLLFWSSIGGILMIVLADKISDFLSKNRMYEVLGLFILFLVGIMLVTEGGHLAHINIAGHPVEQMSKSTFYFILIILILTDIAQGRYQKNLIRKQELEKKNKV